MVKVEPKTKVEMVKVEPKTKVGMVEQMSRPSRN